MKFVLIACLGSLALAQQEPALQGPGPFIRDLTADTLRDFPDLCFSSTNFRLHLENQSWSLFPFCGRADCVKKGDNFVERVHDCGPQPKNGADCTISNLAELQRNDTILEYPACCPKYTCPEGITLQYPTEKEIQAEIEKQTQTALQAAKEAAAARESAGSA
uniref:Single VWC domain protein 1 n=1 Tax=Penaeus japonicus TaxID=27405 RepID=A0A1Q2SI39_PENJP|nr:single VWC domain protein 1 [Penaeus japonicus]